MRSMVRYIVCHAHDLDSIPGSTKVGQGKKETGNASSKQNKRIADILDFINIKILFARRNINKKVK